MIDLDVSGKVYACADVSFTVNRGSTRLNISPRTAMSISADDAPLYQGFPRQAKVWMKIDHLIGPSGEHVVTSRPQPAQVTIPSGMRFLPSPLVGGRWYPTHGDAYFSADAMTTPAVEPVSYLSGRELITRDAVRLTGGNFLTFSGWSYVAATISMVAVLGPTSADYPLLDQLVPGPDRVALWATDKIDYHWLEMGGSTDPVASLAKTRPIAITMVIDPPSVTTYVSYSPRHHFYSTKTSASEISSRSLDFALGAAGTTRGNYWLLELNIWRDAITNVSRLHDTYFSIYGVHSDWA